MVQFARRTLSAPMVVTGPSGWAEMEPAMAMRVAVAAARRIMFVSMEKVVGMKLVVLVVVGFDFDLG